jgi:hypothetical protein
MAVKEALVAKGFTSPYALTDMTEEDFKIVKEEAKLLPGENKFSNECLA